MAMAQIINDPLKIELTVPYKVFSHKHLVQRIFPVQLTGSVKQEMYNNIPTKIWRNVTKSLDYSPRGYLHMN